MTTITALPTPPTRDDPANFRTRADDFMAALPTFATQTNTVAGEVASNASAASASASAASGSASTATTQAGNASTSADTATTQAGIATTQAGLSAGSADAAAASAASAAAIANAFIGTSTTAWTPAVESKAFTTQSGELYTSGIFVTLVSAGTPSAYGFGQVTSYVGTTLTVDVQLAAGSGSHSDWNISLAGVRGATGAAGVVDATTLASTTHAATNKATPVDADEFPMTDSASSYGLKHVLWSAIKTTLAAVFAGLGANTFTGLQTFLNTKDTVYGITDGAAFELDPAHGNVQTITLTASRTPKATNLAAGQSVLLGIDDGSAYTITWTDGTLSPVWVKSGGSGAAPTLATSGYTWVLLWKAGSTMYGAIVGSP